MDGRRPVDFDRFAVPELEADDGSCVRSMVAEAYTER
jgi:hypothetical protein